MTYADGSFYEGEWKDRLRHGKGTYKYGGTYNDGENRDVYKGEWKDNSRHGKGKLIYKDGSFYEGTWEDGMPRHGKGTYKYGGTYNYGENRDVYEGEFRDGKFHGQGKLIYKDGSVYEGTWENGMPRNGKGTYKETFGRVYEGAFVDGKRHGKVKEVRRFKSLRRRVCRWKAAWTRKNGVQDGSFCEGGWRA